MANNEPVVPADERVYEDTSLGAEIFWEKNRNAIIGGVAAVIVIGIAVAIWLVASHNNRLAAEELFASAASPEGWNKVIEKYPGSMPAADAYFLLAQAQRNEGKIDESTATYEKFLASFPKHPLAGGASLGIAENQEMAGKLDEALNSLRDIQTQYSNAYVAPVAILLESRIYVGQNKLEDARRTLNTLVTRYAQSPLARLASVQLQGINALLPPTPIPAAAPPPVPAPQPAQAPATGQ